MRLATIRSNGATTAVRVDGDRALPLPFPDVGALLESGADWRRRAAEIDESELDVESLDFAPIVPAPEKIICVGLNYADHAAEAGLTLPEYPMLFAKFARSLIGAKDDIVLPAVSERVDWEVELGIVIGSPARNVDASGAADAIAGYTIINDVSVRDWQRRTSQYLQGKTFEATTPAGPYLVTRDDLADHDALDLSCNVDGFTMQSSNTRHLHFTPEDLVAYISSIVTLVPGDLIATGTPGGIGLARTPSVFLEPGNVLCSTVAGLGEQRNRCVATAEVADGDLTAA